MERETTARIRVYGIVQGVGFRPTVSRHALSCGIRGSVCNKGPYVEIIAQGTEEAVREFLHLLRRNPPRRSAILKTDVRTLENAARYDSFSIIESERTTGEIYISPDLAVCEECSAELADPQDRRYQHPFINCTNCGPRMTILDSLPYDRIRTSMKRFPLCPACAREYRDPASRRYDAQPVCCPDCGPEVYTLREGKRGREAIRQARKILAEGGILAVKGIGGFHLCCDASDPSAVRKLRERKRRPVKPFAVMARNLDAVRRECETDEEAEEILTGHQKPVLLLPRKAGGHICEEAAPGNPKLGVMLPYAPVQLLLFDYDDGISVPDCLIMTSGNVSGAPICRDDETALRELGEYCDEILSHDRAIRIRADDSVMDRFRGEPYMIRRSRGYAPLPFLVSAGTGCVLAVGGELKNTFCVSRGNLFYPSPYVGDLEDIRTQDALRETLDRFLSLLECRPDLIACDLHPGYHSTEIAEELAERYGVPLMRIQHHYAHVLSCMAEHDRTEEVIGVSFDGTGYGTDGTVWGGEILTCGVSGFERKMHIVPFRQTGGDAASREGWRIAVSLIYSLTRKREETAEIARRVGFCTPQQAETLMQMADRGINTVMSTSAGRLFDAVSALLGLCFSSTFEGEASTSLQFAAEEWERMQTGRETASGGESARRAELSEEILREYGEAEGMPLLSLPDGESRYFAETAADTTGYRLATDELFRYIAGKRLTQGTGSGELAYAFHAILSAQICEACRLVRMETGIGTAVLSGGVFQNTLLLDLTVSGLEKMGFTVLTHHLIPPNDGGIALGQALAAAAAREDGDGYHG